LRLKNKLNPLNGNYLASLKAGPVALAAVVELVVADAAR